MPNGKKCRAAALRNLPYCYFHTRAHRLTGSKSKSKGQPLKFPVLEDRSAIQLALAQILDALASVQIDHKQASLLLYGLQIASQNVSRDDTSILSRDTVLTVTRTSDGQELAPESFACDHPKDCATCKKRNSCILYRATVALSGGTDPLDNPGEGEDNENGGKGG